MKSIFLLITDRQIFYREKGVKLLKFVVLVSNVDSTVNEIKNYIPTDFTLLECKIEETMKLLNNLISAIILIDLTTPNIVSRFKEIAVQRIDLTYIGLASSEKEARTASRYFYDYILEPFNMWKVEQQLQKAWERSELMAGGDRAPGNGMGSSVDVRYTTPEPSRQIEHVLREFSRALSSNFNRERLLDMFLYTVGEFVPVGKLSVLLQDNNTKDYKITASKGIDPEICGKLPFKSEEGIIAWLQEEGRILLPEDLLSDSRWIPGALQEMKLLQTQICIPLQAKGRLVGVLNLGPKVTGASFFEDELEMLYIISGNVAMALLDIDLHHQLCYQKAYMESVLIHMNSGVVAIDLEEKVTTFNTRAAEILDLENEKVLNKDLRSLPSPLGDHLYEALKGGKCYQKKEIELAWKHVPLEISTYQMISDRKEVLGSGMIFEDISERKQLEKERRKTDQLDVLNRFVGQLAHEIKNPMVAIQTFAELLKDKYDDHSFRDSFARTVRKEVKRLNELVEQLIAFSSSISYKFDTEDLYEIVDRGLLNINEQGNGEGVSIDFSYNDTPLKIRADKNLLPKAISYLLLNTLQVFTQGGELFIASEYDKALFENGGVRLYFWDSQTKAETLNIEKMFDPLQIQQSNSILLGLPVSKKIIEDHGGMVKSSAREKGLLKLEVSLPVLSK